MRFFYARTSTTKQNLGRQIEKAEALGVDKIYQDQQTGSNLDRPEWLKLMKRIKSGDVIYFDSVSRMSRNADEGVEIYFELVEKGVELVFINEPLISSKVYLESTGVSLELTGNEIADEYIKTTNKVMKMIARKQIVLAFEQAEKELMDIRKRVTEGMAVAKASGKQIGRKKGCKSEKQIDMPIGKIKKLSKKFNGNLTNKDLANVLKISESTLKRWIKKIKDGK